MTINILPVPKADYGLNPAVVGPGYNIYIGDECYIPGLTIKTEDGVSKTLYSCINLHLGDLQLGAGINLAYSIGEVDTVLWEKTYKLASDFIGDIVALTSKKGDGPVYGWAPLFTRAYRPGFGWARLGSAVTRRVTRRVK
jgi:hypothetical protein